MILNIDQIKKLIPHRNPFLFIEECKIIQRGKTGESFRTFGESEYFFEGHFPENPIVPGVVIVEAMAQTAACLISYGDKSLAKNSLVFFTGIEKAKFKKPVTPGCILNLKINVIAKKKSLYKFIGEAFVNDNLISSSEFSAMLVDQEKAL